MPVAPDRPAGSRETEPRLRVTQATDEIVVITGEGEFDLASSPMLSSAAARALNEGNDVIVDLSDTSFIDSSVINALFELKTGADRRGLVAVLEAGTDAIVDRVLELATVERVLPRSPSRADALETIQRLSTRERQMPVEGGSHPTVDV
jgi:anti-anti-sigma factor